MVHNIHEWNPSSISYEECLVDEFRSELQQRTVNPKAGDYIQAEWAKASLWLLDTYAPYRDLVIDQAVLRSDLPVEVRADLHWKSALELGMTDGIGYPANGFPRNHRKDVDWVSDIIRLYNPELEPEISIRARQHVLEHLNPATVPERVAGAMMTLAGLRIRKEIGDQVDVIDAACSANICLPAYSIWAEQGYMPHHSVEVVNHNTKKTDERGTYLFQAYMSNAPRLAHGLGVDIVNVGDEDNRTFARASSFYGRQLLENPEKYEAYLMWEAIQLDNVEFKQFDLRNFDTDLVIDANGGKKFDMAWFMTAAYQMPQADIMAVLENLFNVTDKVILQDTLIRHPRAGCGLRKNRRGYEQAYKYRTLLAEQINGLITYHELFVWENGRCEKGYFGRDIGRIALAII